MQKDDCAPIAVVRDLSMRQFNRTPGERRRRRVWRREPADPRLLEMELTESLIMHDTEAAIRICCACRENRRGYFGGPTSATGHSMPVLPDQAADSALKIGPVVRQEIKGNDLRDEASSPRRLFRSPGTSSSKVVGEGVETRRSSPFLKEARLRRGPGVSLRQADAGSGGSSASRPKSEGVRSANS